MVEAIKLDIEVSLSVVDPWSSNCVIGITDEAVLTSLFTSCREGSFSEIGLMVVIVLGSLA
jgi:hypothetical protein